MGGGFAFVWGDAGAGKTDLACAVVLEAVRRGRSAVFTSDADMVAEIFDSYGGQERADEVMRRFTGPEVLALDDLGKLAPGEKALARVWQVVDRRYRDGKTTVVTSNLDPKGLAAQLAAVSPTVAGPIVSRVAGDVVVHMTGNFRNAGCGR